MQSEGTEVGVLQPEMGLKCVATHPSRVGGWGGGGDNLRRPPCGGWEEKLEVRALHAALEIEAPR